MSSENLKYTKLCPHNSTNMSTLAHKQAQALKVNTQASHKMLGKYLQLGMR